MACETKIYIFNFNDYQLIDTVNTYYNPKGIFDVSLIDNANTLIYPDTNKGTIGIKIINNANLNKQNIVAHESEIACITLNRDASLFATASDKGTLIRLFNLSDGTLIKELRRGTDKAEILCISFSITSELLSCTSDRGTIHIFRIAENKNSNEDTNANLEGTNTNKKRSNSFKFGKLFKLSKNETSFAKFKINEERAICCFGPNNTIIVIGASGKYYQACYSPLGDDGYCSKLQENKFKI